VLDTYGVCANKNTYLQLTMFFCHNVVQGRDKGIQGLASIMVCTLADREKGLGVHNSISMILYFRVVQILMDSYQQYFHVAMPHDLTLINKAIVRLQ